VGTDAILGLGIQGVVTYILILIMKNNHKLAYALMQIKKLRREKNNEIFYRKRTWN
jgi:hypothetical protein